MGGPKFKETELAEKFIEYFAEGYEIYKEVPAGGIIDIVAINKPIIIAVEVKVRLSFEVIEQAVQAKHYAHYSYVAVPSCRLSFAEEVCKMFGIGILFYDKFGGVKEVLRPKINRKIIPIKFHEYMKESVAGSQNQRMTAFKNSIRHIVSHLKRHKGKDTIKDTLESFEHHWSNFSSAKSCIYQWCSRGIIKEFRLEGKFLILNDVEENN